MLRHSLTVNRSNPSQLPLRPHSTQKNSNRPTIHLSSTLRIQMNHRNITTTNRRIRRTPPISLQRVHRNRHNAHLNTRIINTSQANRHTNHSILYRRIRTNSQKLTNLRRTTNRHTPNNNRIRRFRHIHQRTRRPTNLTKSVTTTTNTLSRTHSTLKTTSLSRLISKQGVSTRIRTQYHSSTTSTTLTRTHLRHITYNPVRQTIVRHRPPKLINPSQQRNLIPRLYLHTNINRSRHQTYQNRNHHSN